MSDQTPKPGSYEAWSNGCICPVVDNHHGRGRPSVEGPVWIVTDGCPMHGMKELPHD